MEDHKILQFTCGDYSHGSDVKITRSGPDIRLTELEQQLEVAETRCGSLKSQLDYMKMLYQGVQPCSTDLIQTVEEIPEIQPKNVAQYSPRETVQTRLDEDEENYQENITTDLEDVKYYRFLKEIQKMQEITRESDDDLERKSLKSAKITPRFIEHHSAVPEEDHESISAECRHTKQIRKTHILLGTAAGVASEPASILTSLTAAATSLRIPEVTTICKEQYIEDAGGFRNLNDYSTRLQTDMATARNLTSRFMSENKCEGGGNGLGEQKKETKKQELVLKLSESMESAPITVKRKRVTKVDKKQKIGWCAGSGAKKTLNSKNDDTNSVTSNNKNRKKKAKLRNANSRNTVLTKETNLTDRRDSKKRKQKGYSSATHMPHLFQTPMQRLSGPRAEVVEIYHNNAVEGGSGSISNSSSKHSKHEATNNLQNNNPVMKKAPPSQICSSVTYQRQQIHVNDHTVVQKDTDTGATFDKSNDEGLRKYSARSQKSQNYAIQNANGGGAQCSSAPHPLGYYDPTIIRNYELPTVASKLKKVNRSYFNRFNFRNIPFVVSTSVTPSHNLGLNIQQVLSIMKTRQPMATGMGPLLIRKMSRGIKPLLNRSCDTPYSPKSLKSTILGGQNDFVSHGRPKTVAECIDSLNQTVEPKYTSYLTTQVGRLQFIPNAQNNSDGKTSQDPLLDEEQVQRQESGCICCPKKSKSYNRMLKQYTSRKSITGNPTLTASTLLRERQEEINIGDNQYNHSEHASGKAKGIREVLINLHDQFEELNMKYEKLQEKAAKSSDKAILKQAQALEKELNAKEEEINAVVGLYKEVLQLKQQVHSINGKNSFVCIATSGDPSSPPTFRRSGHMRTQLATNPMQIFNMRGKNFAPNVREPATATRLTGLLREIQSFQKQLLAL